MQRFVITWAPGPRWIEGASIVDQPFVEEHADHLDRLMSEQRILLSGPFVTIPGITPTTVGMTVITATDEASAQVWLAADPAIANRVLTADVRPFQAILETQADAPWRGGHLPRDRRRAHNSPPASPSHGEPNRIVWFQRSKK